VNEENTMLSIAAMSKEQTRYYVSFAEGQGEELSHESSISYYAHSKHLEPAGFWVGGGAKALGIEGPVLPTDLEKIAKGYHPDGTPLVKNAGHATRQPGWDLTFSAPKSVSVAWSQATPELRRAIEAVQLQAVGKAVSVLEKEHVLTRRGVGGKILETGKLVVATFEHGYSRALDPHLHTHCLVMNVVTRADGTTGAVLSHPFYDEKMAIGRVYREELARGLKSLGFTIKERPDGLIDILGVPEELMQAMSQRRAQVLERLEARGLSSAAAAAVATLATREMKAQIRRIDLFPEWQAIGRAHGFSAIEVELLRTPHLANEQSVAQSIKHQKQDIKQPEQSVEKERALDPTLDHESQQHNALQQHNAPQRRDESQHQSKHSSEIGQQGASVTEQKRELPSLTDKEIDKLSEAEMDKLIYMALGGKEPLVHEGQEDHYSPTESLERGTHQDHLTNQDHFAGQDHFADFEKEYATLWGTDQIEHPALQVEHPALFDAENPTLSRSKPFTAFDAEKAAVKLAVDIGIESLVLLDARHDFSEEEICKIVYALMGRKEEPSPEHLSVPEETLVSGPPVPLVSSYSVAIMVRECLLEHPAVFPRGVREGMPYFALVDTSPEISQRIVDSIRQVEEIREHPVKASVVEGVLKTRTFTEPQEAALRNLTQEGGCLKILDGPAGSGKSSILGAAKEIWEKAGYKVMGIGMSGAIVHHLDHEQGIQSYRLGKLLHDQKKTWVNDLLHEVRMFARAVMHYTTWKNNTLVVDDKTILLVDEAQVISKTPMNLLLSTACSKGAKVVLAGDTKERQDLPYKGSFYYLKELLGGITLTGNHRQEVAWERDVVDTLTYGNVRAALHAYAEEGRLTIQTGKDNVRKRLVSDWFDGKPHKRHKQVILTTTEHEAKQMNVLVQQERIKRGEIYGFLQCISLGVRVPKQHLRERLLPFKKDPPAGDGEKLYKGDRVVFKLKSGYYKVNAGELGTVKKTHFLDHAVTVQLDSGKLITVSVKHYRHLGLGYAHAMKDAPRSLLERAYVLLGSHSKEKDIYFQASRATKETQFYGETEDLKEWGIGTRMQPVPDPLLPVHTKEDPSHAPDDISYSMSQTGKPPALQRTAQNFEQGREATTEHQLARH
jgi:conjugative relaxase-like TrwC/TraI family protein